ncbi:MAG TPA: helix-turn-helix domain-containing protein [Humisphaera sp.]
MAALTLRQAAKELGVHPATLARWIRDGEGPRALIKPGRTRSVIRIRQVDLLDFIRRNSRGGR